MTKEAWDKYTKVSEAKHKLIDWAMEEFSKEKSQIDTKEMGEVIDMIKDLAETEKLCMETCYYETVVEAMKEGSEEYRMGYGRGRMNAWRPDGIIDKPYVDQMSYVEDFVTNDWEDRMGYQGGRSGGRGGSRGSNSGLSGGSRGGSMGSSSGYITYPQDRMMNDDRYGSSYNRYREMRRHYSATNDPMDKEEMSMSAREHLMDTAESIRDIWKDADPDMKRKMKSDLTNLINGLS